MSKYVVNGEILGLTVKYTVDTEARTVTGIIDDIHLQTKVLDELNNQLMSTSAISEISNCLLLNETIEVIVECRPEDSFSADFGVQLAQRRLTDKINSLGVENALYTLYKVDEHLSILLTRKGSRNRQITLFISQRCIISIAKQICFVNTTYGSKT